VIAEALRQVDLLATCQGCQRRRGQVVVAAAKNRIYGLGYV